MSICAYIYIYTHTHTHIYGMGPSSSWAQAVCPAAAPRSQSRQSPWSPIASSSVVVSPLGTPRSPSLLGSCRDPPSPPSSHLLSPRPPRRLARLHPRCRSHTHPHACAHARGCPVGTGPSRWHPDPPRPSARGNESPSPGAKCERSLTRRRDGLR